MFNLLPKAEKEAIRREYRMRLAVVILWFSFATLLIASFLLLPAFVLSSAKEKAAVHRFATLSAEVESANGAKLRDLLADTQSRLRFFSKKAPAARWHEILTQLVSLKPDGVSLMSVSFTDGENGSRRVTIAGTARNRTGLRAFAKSLERVSFFEKIDVPISNYTKDTDIEFSIHITGRF
jgi:Tfp pilus assembly protein PilN